MGVEGDGSELSRVSYGNCVSIRLHLVRDWSISSGRVYGSVRGEIVGGVWIGGTVLGRIGCRK